MAEFPLASFEEIDRAFDEPARQDKLREAFGEAEFEEIKEMRGRPAPFGALEGRRMVILPGIMGSVLTDIAGNRGDLWPSLGILTGLDFNALELNGEGEKELFLDVVVKARSLIPFCYFKLFTYFKKKNYLVTQCPFDWRRRIDSSVIALKEHIDVMAAAGEKVYLAAHSMGGLVARRYIDLHPDHAKAHVEHLFMMGTPNHGSYAPPMAFSGKHSIVNNVGWLLGGGEISRGIVASFPGLYEMFPDRELFGQPELYKGSFFPEGISEAHLKGSIEFQGRLAAVDAERMTIFATQSEKTVVSAQIEESGEYKYMAAKTGDGTVPIRSANIPGIKTYLSTAGHAWIPRETDVMRAIEDLIRTGSCDLREYQPRFAPVDEELEEVSADFPAFAL